MRVRRALPLVVIAMLVTGAVAAPISGLTQRAVVAQRRAMLLERRADAVADPARRARLRQAAVAARATAAEVDIDTLRARAATLARRLAAQRAVLAVREGPTARWLAALVAIARRSPVLAIAQPGSVTDLVHAQAVLAATVPAMRARSAALRAAVANDRTAEANVAAAERRLRVGRARLVEAREQLAAVTDTDDERALAMEEAVRDTAERLATIGSEQAVLADLLVLPAPHAAPAALRVSHAYALPVRGRLVTGMGEVSGNGVRARGLTLAVPAAAVVAAPAAGRIGYAGPFRSFGRIVIIDHGAGWVSLLSGLGTLAVRRGAAVVAGAPIGRAPNVEGARITVELRRHGRPMDIAQLAG